jgi:hypothetical protein
LYGRRLSGDAETGAYGPGVETLVLATPQAPLIAFATSAFAQR